MVGPLRGHEGGPRSVSSHRRDVEARIGGVAQCGLGKSKGKRDTVAAAVRVAVLDRGASAAERDAIAKGQPQHVLGGADNG